MGKPWKPSTLPEDAKALRAQSASRSERAGSRSSSIPSKPSKCPMAGPIAALSKLDVTIRRLTQLISTSAGQERVLSAIQYNSQILHYILSSNAARSVSSGLRLTKPSGLPLPSQSTPAKPRLLALSSVISETRTVLRLFGLVKLWSWGSATAKAPPRDPILRAIAYSQVFVNVVYQLLENIAFLSSKGIISRRIVERFGSIGKWYIWSTRAWLAHVVLDIIRLVRERILWMRRPRKWTVEQLVNEGEEEEQLRWSELRERLKALLNNMAWLPLCMHWSAEEGIGIPDSLVGLLGATAGAWGLRDAWVDTAAMV
ncbi:hypothetical protein FQN53_006697 [Emmonsiellopsis sp. PD_33]|nr:hypothetical protein FQN53_006697 [Emmonsiellopsis sp. PD_33]